MHSNLMQIIKLLSSKYPDKFKINKILGFAEENLALETKSFLVNEILSYIFKPNENTSNGRKCLMYILIIDTTIMIFIN